MSPFDEALEGASKASRARISDGLASCDDGAKHVRKSKKAIARSLNLLSATRPQVPDA
jgi:hypothetical protein